VLDRAIAERGRYPAVDVLRSLSRTVPGVLDPDQRESAARARRVLALQAEMAELVRLGAYRAGTDAEVDAALAIAPRIEALLAQGKGEATPIEAAFAALREVLDAKA
jgi:flagellum-specific ATP synthase